MDDFPLTKKIETIEEQIIEKIADNMRHYGISPTVGRVLGIIYLNRKAMTLNELSEETGMSKTRMSQVVREMVDLTIADKVFEKGVRKDLYNVEQDYYQTFISLFTSNWQKACKKNKLFGKKLISELEEILEQEDIEEEAKQKILELQQEMQEWMNYYEWLDQVVDFFDSGEVFKHIPKPK